MKSFLAKGSAYKRLKEGIHLVTIDSIDYKMIDDIIETDRHNNPIVEIVFRNKDNYKIKKNIILNNVAKDTFKRIANACKVIWKDEFDITSLEKKKLQIIVVKIFLTKGGEKVLDSSKHYDCYYKVKNLYFKDDDKILNPIPFIEYEEIGQTI